MRHPQNNNEGIRMSYMALKHIHLVAVGIGFALLLLRGFLMTTGSMLHKRRWMRIFTHLNYAVLFLAGIALSLKVGFKPGDLPWLVVKIAGLIVLIVLGASILPRLRGSSAKFTTWLIAILLFLYLVAVALTKNAQPWLAL